MQDLLFVILYSRQLSELGFFKTAAIEKEKLHLVQYRYIQSPSKLGHFSSRPHYCQSCGHVLLSISISLLYSLLSLASVSYVESQSCLPASFHWPLHSQQLHYQIYCFHITVRVPLAPSSPIPAFLLISQLSAPFTDLFLFPYHFSPSNVFPISLLPHSLPVLPSCPGSFHISSQQLTPRVFLVPTQSLRLACHSRGCYALCRTYF